MVINFADKGNYKTFKKHIKKVLFTYRKTQKIILILDNVRYHHAKLFNKFILEYPKLEIMYLPPYSPDLNPVERAWWYMRKKITHNRYLSSLADRKAKFWIMFSHFLIPNEKLLKVCNVNF